MKSRSFEADIIRSFAILFVVINHNFVFTHVSSVSNIIHILIFSIIKTSVPLFVMLSGALLLKRKEKNSIFFKKRLKKVVIPWVLWTFIFIIINYVTNTNTFSSPGEFLAVLYQTFFSQFWFIPMIVGLYFLTPIWKIVVQKGEKNILLYFISLWFIFTSFFPSIHPNVTFPIEPQGLFMQILSYSGYYILGYIIINKILTPIKNSILIIISVLCLCINYLDYMFFNSSIKTFSYFNTPIFVLSICIFMLVLQSEINKKFNDNTKNLITKICKVSFSIYIYYIM